MQVADPQHQFGDRGGARVEFEAEELVRVDGEAFGSKPALRVAESVELVEHFAFEALQVFERDVEKIARAAGRVEHAHARTGAWWKLAHFVACGFELAFGGEQQRGGLHVGPVGAQRFDDGGQHQALDVGARRVVGAERVALGGVERAFEQGAEDGRFDLLPVGAGGFDQQVDLRRGRAAAPRAA